MKRNLGNSISKHINRIAAKSAEKSAFLKEIHTNSSNFKEENIKPHNEKVDPTALVKEKITWQNSKNGVYPYFFKKGNAEFEIRVNDFPAEPVYTLIVDGKEISNLESWPENWQRPNPNK